MKKPLFIFEMANNHMGDLSHGIKIIRELKKITKKFSEFDFAVKLQLRDDSFFHKDHIHRKDHKLIKRFTETRLGKDFIKLIKEIKKNGFISMCTPWDELATKYLIDIKIDILKIASCSFNDWYLLDSTKKYKKKIIASTAGAKEIEIDKAYSFFRHQNKDFSFMHCVGEYPTPDENLHLNQIEYLKKRYPKIEIGYSTHERPDNYSAISIAIAKGATIFEKHVGLKNKKYGINDYSATPEMVEKWLAAAKKCYSALGQFQQQRKNFSKKELSDLRILHRGVYAKGNLKKGSLLSKKNIYLAMPNVKGQLVAKEIGMFNKFYPKKNISRDEPIMLKDLSEDSKYSDISDKRFFISNLIKDKIYRSNITVPKSSKVEISHHYGIKNFFKVGAVLFHIINKEYSKILVMMFKGQKYPDHYHLKKTETYLILEGDLEIKFRNKKINLYQGDVYTVKKNIVHSFKTKNGVIFEEIATRYIKGDSKYLDKKVHKDRKTKINIFD
jgi:sialic acid synthase SpsE/mannose-6-phosphate isomerase-like protein (cupin superfamily)